MAALVVALVVACSALAACGDDPLPAAAPSTTTSTTVPTTTTEPPRPEVHVGAASPVLPTPTGSTLVFYEGKRDLLVALDLDTGDWCEVRPPRREAWVLGTVGSEALWVGGRRTWTMGAGCEITMRTFGQAAFASDRPDAVWEDAGETWREADLFGEPTGRTVPRPQGTGAIWPVRGGFVVDVAGTVEWFDAATGASTPVAPAPLVAARGDVVVTLDCGGGLSCDVLVHRLGGGGSDRYPVGDAQPGGAAAVSPDERWLVTGGARGPTIVLDLVEGVGTAHPWGVVEVDFTTDSRWVVVDGGPLFVPLYGGEPVVAPVGEDAAVESFAVLPRRALVA